MILRRLTGHMDLTITLSWLMFANLFGSYFVLSELAQKCIGFHLTGGTFDQAFGRRNWIRESSL